MSATRCQAKNPDLCWKHGTGKKPAVVDTPTPAEDLFAAAIASNPRIAAMEAQIKWADQKRQELARDYETSNTLVAAEYHPLAWDDPALHALNNEYEQVDAKLTDEEREALKEFTGILYQPVNEHLRDPAIYKARFRHPERYPAQLKRVEEHIRTLDSALAKHKPAEPARELYRVINQDHTEQLTSSEGYAQLLRLQEGNTVTFTGFSSTTLDPAFVNRCVSPRDQHTAVVLILTTRSGAPVSRTALNPEQAVYTQDTEREVLLPRNTNWKVLNVSRNRFHGRGDWDEPVEPLTIHLEEIE